MIIETVDDFVEKVSDPRVKSSHRIWEPAIIIVTYMILVKLIGPRFMENRKPYNIKKIVMIFDAIQVIANLYFVFAVTRAITLMSGSYFCLDLDSSESYLGLHTLYLTKFYYWLKISDLLDTIFFVLKKSWRQVSYLHVYHHSVMIFISWLAVKLAPGGHCAYFGLANSFIHTLMYSYYLLSAYDPSYKENLSLKKFITQMQLIQFVFIVTVFAPTLRSSCSLPSVIGLAAVTQATYFLYLFGMFYYNSYVKISRGVEQQRVKSE